MRTATLFFLLWVLLVACDQPVGPSLTLPVGGPAQTFTLPALSGGLAAERSFRLSNPTAQTVQLQLVSSLGLASRPRLTLLDSQGQPLARAVGRSWFGIPQVALASVQPANLYRINWALEAGQTYTVQVENLAGAADTLQLQAVPFTPNPLGDNTPLSSGFLTGAIELLGEYDLYDLSMAPAYQYLHLDYRGPIDLVALVYTGASNPLILEATPGFDCVAVGGATQVMVRDRSAGSTVAGPGARAGFDQEGSGRYTLSLLPACP